MAAINPAGFGGGDTAALPVQPQNGSGFAPAAGIAPASAIAPQNGTAFVPPPAPVVPPVVNTTNNIQPVAAPMAPAVMAAAAQAPAGITGGVDNMQPVMPAQQAPIVQNAQNGYMPGPQQVQNSDGEQNNVHFGEIGYDPFTNAISGGKNTAWK